MLGYANNGNRARENGEPGRARTSGVNLTWISDQTGVAEGTLRERYGRFIHSSESDAIELAKIDPGRRPRQFTWPPFGYRRRRA